MAAVPRAASTRRKKDSGRNGRPSNPLLLDAFLERHPEIEEIEICTNNDFAGLLGRSPHRESLSGRYRMVKNLPRRVGCDYGDLAKENYERANRPEPFGRFPIERRSCNRQAGNHTETILPTERGFLLPGGLRRYRLAESSGAGRVLRL